jgi:hypothetical protein
MKKKLKILKLLTWYKGLQEEQVKIRVINCRINLEKLLQEKETIISLRKNYYDSLEKKSVFTAEEFKYKLFQIEKNKEFENLLNKKIDMQNEELKTLLKLLEKTYKERKLMENVKNRVKHIWDLENIKRFYKEMDDLVLLRRGRDYV